jgi:hypothetical protein
MTHSRVLPAWEPPRALLASVISGRIDRHIGSRIQAHTRRRYARVDGPVWPETFGKLAAALSDTFRPRGRTTTNCGCPTLTAQKRIATQSPQLITYLSSLAMNRRASSTAFSRESPRASASSKSFAARSTASAEFATAQAPIARDMPFSLWAAACCDASLLADLISATSSGACARKRSSTSRVSLSSPSVWRRK